MRERGSLRRGPDRILAGVCSGLAEYLQLDPTLVRVVFVVLTLVPPGIGIILYFVFWFFMDSPNTTASRTPSVSAGARLRQMADGLRREFWQAPGQAAPAAASAGSGTEAASYHRHSARLWGGIVLIAAGAFLVLANLGYLTGFRWDLFWPVLLIAAGLLVLVRRI